MAWRLDCLLACLASYTHTIPDPTIPYFCSLSSTSLPPVKHTLCFFTLAIPRAGLVPLSFISLVGFPRCARPIQYHLVPRPLLESSIQTPDSLSTTPRALTHPQAAYWVPALPIPLVDSTHHALTNGSVPYPSRPSHFGCSFLPFTWPAPPTPATAPHLTTTIDDLDSPRTLHSTGHNLPPTRSAAIAICCSRGICDSPHPASTRSLVPLHPQFWFAPARDQSPARLCQINPHLHHSTAVCAVLVRLPKAR